VEAPIRKCVPSEKNFDLIEVSELNPQMFGAHYLKVSTTRGGSLWLAPQRLAEAGSTHFKVYSGIFLTTGENLHKNLRAAELCWTIIVVLTWMHFQGAAMTSLLCITHPRLRRWVTSDRTWQAQMPSKLPNKGGNRIR
jgi:hypothetical protein